MARRRKGRAINGIVLLNKEVGDSSNQDLQKVRRLFQAQKAGHTGALDPLASGMLPICLGEATKFSQFLLDADKTYEVTARLGIRTTTSDADGEIVSEKPVKVSVEHIHQACQSFVGESMQVPSMYSALKFEGRPLYSYAREGITVPREARKITIFSLQIHSVDLPDVRMTVHCSKGTYIRSLVDDLGEQLGCGAYVTRLHRTKVANYPNESMQTLAQLSALSNDDDFSQLDALLLPMDTAVLALPASYIGNEEATKFNHGQEVNGTVNDSKEGDFVRVYLQKEDKPLFLGVGEQTQHGLIQPKRVVVY